MTVKQTKANPLGMTPADFTVEGADIQANKGLYHKYRSEDITDDIEKKVDKYRSNYVASVVAVAGDMALDQMTGDVDRVTISAPMLNNSSRCRATVVKERTQSVPGSDRTVKKFGATTVSVRISYGRRVGAIKSSMEWLSEQAEARFAGGS